MIPVRPQSVKTEGFGLGTADVRRRHIAAKAAVVGAVAGLIASGFRVALRAAEQARVRLSAEASTPLTVIAVLAVGIVGGALAVWLVRRFSPDAAGSGIPHVKAVALGEATMDWRWLMPVKFLGAIAGIGSGLALGREGPTIQMGGATGLMVSEWFRVKPGEGERKALICAGAAAGLAAAFNAPLAGVVFVLEELHGAFTPVVFVGAFIASVTADVIGRLITGELPVFALRDAPSPGLSAVPLALVLGAACGLIGVAFNFCILKSVTVFARLRSRPLMIGGVAGLIVASATLFGRDLGGSGGPLAERALTGDLALAWIPALLLARFALTVVSYGSGAAGGIFAPLLVIGALGGLGLGGAAHAVMPTFGVAPSSFAIIGMGALLTAVVRAPLTSIVLMVELTGKPDFMLPLLAGSLVAYGVAEGLGSHPLYESLRELRARAASTRS